MAGNDYIFAEGWVGQPPVGWHYEIAVHVPIQPHMMWSTDAVKLLRFEVGCAGTLEVVYFTEVAPVWLCCNVTTNEFTKLNQIEAVYVSEGSAN